MRHSSKQSQSNPKLRVQPLHFVIFLLVAALCTGGAIAGNHYLHVRSVKKKEAAKQKNYDPSKLKEVTKNATSDATTTTPGAASSTSTTTLKPINLSAKTSGVTWHGTTEQMSYGGLQRNYEVFRPTGTYTQDLPVVVMLAGAAVTSKFEASRDQLIANLPPAIVIFPGESSIKGDENWNAGHCCGEPVTHNVDDVGFVNTVIATVEKQPGVAQNDVYLAGYSNGGKLAQLMACEDASAYKALATFGSVPSFVCPDWKAIPEMVLAGTADPELTIGPGGKNVVQGGFTEPKVSDLMAMRLKANGCSATTDSATSGSFTETRWIDCSGGTVALGIYDGHAHGWPTTTGSTPGASAVIADFLESEGLPATEPSSS